MSLLVVTAASAIANHPTCPRRTLGLAVLQFEAMGDFSILMAGSCLSAPGPGTAGPVLVEGVELFGFPIEVAKLQSTFENRKSINGQASRSDPLINVSTPLAPQRSHISK